MKNLNEIVAENLIDLRKHSGLTQQQLADELTYSDKTISKWELGKAVPTVDVLIEVAKFYDVSVEYLITEHNNSTFIGLKKTRKQRNKIIIAFLLCSIILLIATTVFVYSIFKLNKEGIFDPIQYYWQIYVWSIPAICLLLYVCTRRWWKEKRILKFIVLSLFFWTLLASFYIQFRNDNLWYLFFMGIPIQLVLFFLYQIK